MVESWVETHPLTSRFWEFERSFGGICCDTCPKRMGEGDLWIRKGVPVALLVDLCRLQNFLEDGIVPSCK